MKKIEPDQSSKHAKLLDRLVLWVAIAVVIYLVAGVIFLCCRFNKVPEFIFNPI